MRDKERHLQSNRSNTLLERLQQHPDLLARIEELLDVVDNSTGDATKADEAEQRVFEELRRIGQVALQAWAERKHNLIEIDCNSRSDLTRKEKKLSTGIPGLGR
jgi:hypothetical protein